MPQNSLRNWTICAFLLGCAISPKSAIAAPESDAGQMHWKAVVGAQLKIDDKIPLTWNVYQPDKKKQSNLVLALLGHRYLMLDIKKKHIYQVMPSDLHAQDRDFDSGDLAKPALLIPTTNWNDRDVGPAEVVQVTLGDYGRVLEVELPHMPDMRPFY